MRIIILVLITVLSLSSCKEAKKTNKPVAPKQETVKLWKANTATTVGINQMKTRINSFNFSEKNEDYITLKNELVDDFNGILTACTMQGEAHEHLHDYLVPMKGLLDGITPENSLVNNKELVHKYQKHLEKYNTIFK